MRLPKERPELNQQFSEEELMSFFEQEAARQQAPAPPKDMSHLLVTYSARGIEGQPLVEIFVTKDAVAKEIVSRVPDMKDEEWIPVPSYTDENVVIGYFKVTDELRTVRIVEDLRTMQQPAAAD